jgi:hypothetical protein
MDAMKPQVMLLGTYHLHESESMGIDITSDERQNELLDIARKIAVFMPNKIAIQKLPRDEKSVNVRYHTYLEDEIIDVTKFHHSRTLYKNTGDVNEIVMLAFRIGKLCGVPNLIGINYVNIGFIFKMFALRYARRKAPDTYRNVYEKEKDYFADCKEVFQGALLDTFIYLNQQANIKRQHDIQFMEINQIGAFNNFIGTKFVSSWYARNLHIFANIQSICKENDRVLVLYGCGHLATLESMVNDYSEIELVSPLEYLKKK